MIVDALTQAVAAIDRELADSNLERRYPGPTRDRLRWLRNGIEAVRQELEQPPAPSGAAA